MLTPLHQALYLMFFLAVVNSKDSKNVNSATLSFIFDVVPGCP